MNLWKIPSGTKNAKCPRFESWNEFNIQLATSRSLTRSQTKQLSAKCEFSLGTQVLHQLRRLLESHQNSCMHTAQRERERKSLSLGLNTRIQQRAKFACTPAKPASSPIAPDIMLSNSQKALLFMIMPGTLFIYIKDTYIHLRAAREASAFYWLVNTRLPAVPIDKRSPFPSRVACECEIFCNWSANAKIVGAAWNEREKSGCGGDGGSNKVSSRAHTPYYWSWPYLVLQQGRRRLANLERLAGLPLPSPLPPLSVTTLLLSRIAHSAQMYANMFL